MHRRSVLGLIWLCSLLLASCSRQVENPQPAKTAAPAVTQASPPEFAGPMLVESYRKIELQPGAQLQIWNIQAHGLKELNASLLTIREGETHVASKIEYKWEKWEREQPAAQGQILFLMQDGQLFGVADKRFPLLTVDFPKLPDFARGQMSSNLPIEGPLLTRMSTSTNEGSLMSFPPGQTHTAILYGEIFGPPNDLGTVSLGSNLESLTAAATSGRVVVAVKLEWVTQ